jgi:hypothetical protein
MYKITENLGRIQIDLSRVKQGEAMGAGVKSRIDYRPPLLCQAVG